MKIFGYIYYRIYQWNETRNYIGKKKPYSPDVMTFRYISLLQMAITFPLIFFGRKLLMVSGLMSKEVVDSTVMKSVFCLVIPAIIFIWSYLRYGRAHPDWHKDDFSSYRTLNLSIKTWMLMLLPAIIVIIYISVYVWLFGGVVLGKDIKGFF